LPKTLKSLTLFCNEHKQKVDFKYLSNLTKLELSNYSIESFHKLGNIFSINLKILRLSSSRFADSLSNLPKTLECFILDCNYFNSSLNNLPNLKRLVINSNMFDNPVNELPETLMELQISSRSFNQSLSNLPKNLQILKIYSDKLNQKLSELPNNLHTLILDCIRLKNSLPNPHINLKTILIYDYYSHDKYLNNNPHKYSKVYNEGVPSDNIRIYYRNLFIIDDCWRGFDYFITVT